MQVKVEFAGLSRVLVRDKVTTLELPESATFRSAAGALAERFPELVGVILTPGRNDLLNANMFSRNGEDLILEDQMDDPLQDGDRILLLSVIVGGSKAFNDCFPIGPGI